MGINSTEVAFGFGQMGSAYLADQDAYTPPTGKVVVAITILDSATKFAVLTPDTSAYTDGTTGAAGTGVSAYIGTSTTFPVGITLYGRWTTVDLGAGSVILYLADS